ncbi:MAG: ComEC/Rec2 family competence protein [Verrucomicrobiota bacterium]
MHTKARWIRAALLGSFGLVSLALGYSQELYVRVVDVGAGECVVVKAPGNGSKDHYMIYDAGNYEDKGKTAIEAIREIIPEGSTIDLLVLSHSDSDHLAAVPEIMDEYKVKRVIHPGYERPTATWKESNQAILDEARLDGCRDLNLANVEIAPGSSYRIGKATAVFVAGFHKPPEEWGQLSDSEEKNAGSVIIRLIYKGKSILLCGDAVGRHIDDAEDACIAMEQYVADNTEAVKIDSDVMVAPHHGADNGSSKRFIEEVSPEYVIFPAGHKFDHPRKAAADRYLAAGVSLQKMFRTDREDDESKGGDWEWAAGRKTGEHDKPGDDDVVVTVSAAGVITVKYLNP